LSASGFVQRKRMTRLQDWGVALGSVALYALAVRLVFPLIGRPVFVLALFPLLVIAARWGAVGGALAAALHIPFAFLLFRRFMPDAAALLSDGLFWSNHLALATVGILGGLLFDLRRIYREQLRRVTASEEALRDAELRYRTIFDNAADSIVIYDMEGRFLEANQVACDWFGLSLEALLTMQSADVTPAQVLADDTPRMMRLRRGESVVFESAHRRPDGTEIPVEVSSRVIQYRGQPAVLSIARDITKRRKAAEALRASQQMLQLIMDHIPLAVFWKDRDLVYLGCNRRFAADSGMASPQQIVGKTDDEMPWRDQVELYRADDRAVMASGVPKLYYEEPQTTPSGSLIWLRTSKVPLRSAEGQIVAVLGMYEDITERRLADAALRDREQFLTLLNDITRLALESADLGAMAEMLAERLEVLFGAEGCYIALVRSSGQGDSLRGAPQLLAAQHGTTVVCRADDPRCARLIGSVIRSGHPLAIEDLQETPPLGRQIAQLFPGYALLTLPLIAGQQRLGAVFLAFSPPHAISAEELARGEQVAAQIALAVSKAHLVEALRAYITELEARNEELDAFGHTVAHDLKEPLSIMMGYASLLSLEGDQLQPDQVKMALQALDRQGQRMQRIIDELLLMAGLRSAEVSSRAMDMDGIVKEALLRFTQAIEKQQATVKLPATWPVALGYGP